MRKVWAGLKKLAFHPNPVWRAVVSVSFVGGALWANFFKYQVFCIPVWWAGLASGLFVLSVLLLPLIRNHWVKTVLYFVAGTGVPICIYCVLFLAGWNYLVYFLGIIFFAGAVFAFLPFYFIYHIARYFKGAASWGKKAMIAGAAIPFLVYLVYLQLFSVRLYAFTDAVNAGPAAIEKLPRDYFTERLLGIGFKYHTELCLWDGWRPPMHDPFLNMSLWLCSVPNSFTAGNKILTLKERIVYYHKLFPDKPIRMHCACSEMGDAKTYFTDYGWDGYFPPDPPVETVGN
jgi:hypothetical protein